MSDMSHSSAADSAGRRGLARHVPWVCSLAGRLLIVACLVYVFGQAVVSLYRVAKEATTGERPAPEEITTPMRGAMSRARAALPGVGIGALIVFAGWMVRIIQSGRTEQDARGGGCGDANGVNASGSQQPMAGDGASASGDQPPNPGSA
jgi:hypothetical protein